MIIMKYHYLIISILITVFFNTSYSQNFSFEELISLNNKSLNSLQHHLYDHQFLLYETKSDPSVKTDSISFINKDKIILQQVTSKKNKILLLKNFKEQYFIYLNNNLHKHGYLPLKSIIQDNNQIINIYINILKKNTIEIHISSNAKEKSEIQNNYLFMLIYDKKFETKYKSYIKNNMK